MSRKNGNHAQVIKQDAPARLFPSDEQAGTNPLGRLSANRTCRIIEFLELLEFARARRFPHCG